MTSFRDKLIQQRLTKRYENIFSVVLRIKTSKFKVIFCHLNIWICGAGTGW